MTERWKIYFMILFIALTVVPISLVSAKINAPSWSLILGHICAIIFGFIVSEISMEVSYHE